ncbi:MAG: urea ABC transporter ATP-binding protein UrtD, partial [Pirellulaceae bacterium]
TITMVFSWILLAYLVLMLVPFLAVSVRRIQDTGRAPWWLLVGALPLTAWLVFPLVNLNLGAAFNLVALAAISALLGVMSLRGTPEANKYGEVPEIAELAGSDEDVAQEDEDGENTGRVDVESRLKRVANIQRLRGDKPQIEANILSVHDLTVVFDGFKALDITEFTLPHYMLQVIIGPNGAGKTTLCDIISGKTRPTTGRVIFSDRDITEMSETDIALMGVGRKFQTPTIYDSLTVYQNMELALPNSQGLAHNLWHSTSREEHDRIFEMLRRVRLDDDAYRLVQALSHGQRQWLEISMLILSSPKLLLVDEPAAGLTDEETILTAELLLELQEEHSIIVIEHDMDFVRLLNAPVTVLNEGLIMAQGSMEEVQADEKVVEAYLGR